MNKNYIKKIWCTDLGLSPFSNNQFYNILECIIIGWKLIPMPNKSEYKPHLVIYPLWENTFNNCMDSPLLLTPMKHKGIDLCVSYDEEKENVHQITAYCSKIIELGKDIRSATFISYLKENFNNPNVKSNFLLQIKLFRLLYGIYLYLDKMELAEDIYTTLKYESCLWDKEIFYYWYGKLDTWINSMSNLKNNRELFIANIQKNSKEKKILNIKHISFM